MTSLGFEDSLNPYEITPADLACVLKGGAFVTEKNVFDRVVTNIQDGSVIGYKYYDFGDDFGSITMEFSAKILGMGCDAVMHILIDGEDGEEIGCCRIGHDSSAIHTIVKSVTGRHAVFSKSPRNTWTGWAKCSGAGTYLNCAALYFEVKLKI